MGVDEIICESGRKMVVLTTRDSATGADDNMLTWVADRTSFWEIKKEMVREWLEERIRFEIKWNNMK